MLDYLIGVGFALGALAILIVLAAQPDPRDYDDWKNPRNWL